MKSVRQKKLKELDKKVTNTSFKRKCSLNKYDFLEFFIKILKQ